MPAHGILERSSDRVWGIPERQLSRRRRLRYARRVAQVFDLWFEREYSDREDTELHIGIYETESDAREAIVRIRDQPGFRDFPEGFNIYPFTLGRTGWTEGFVTELVPAEGQEATDNPA